MSAVEIADVLDALSEDLALRASQFGVSIDAQREAALKVLPTAVMSALAQVAVAVGKAAELARAQGDAR